MRDVQLNQWKWWQWWVLVLPIVAIATFLLVSAGWQIHQWRVNWVWGPIAIGLLGWRWLLVRWTRPQDELLEQLFDQLQELQSPTGDGDLSLDTSAPLDASELDADEIDADERMTAVARVEQELQAVVKASRKDKAVWEDWATFWLRCQTLVEAISRIYHPSVKYPLLSIYVPQAYGLIRGTVDDMDRMMQQLQPVLGQVTVGQVYRGYEAYRQLEPTARRVLKVWSWAQWVLNPVAALAKEAGRSSSQKANQELLANLSQLLRETALRNLCQQAISLYGGTTISLDSLSPALAEAKTLTLKDILSDADSQEAVAAEPVNILIVGRTGAGKSSLINSMFSTDLAAVDLLPSTDAIQTYEWESADGNSLVLWDTPGYEQSGRSDYRQLVLDYARDVDVLVLVNPALDPSLQADSQFLQDVTQLQPEVSAIAVVTQVDRLRPLREWEPPYDWREGQGTKESNIREAVTYRVEQLGEYCELTLPVVNGDRAQQRQAWGIDELSRALVEEVDPVKQARLAQFLQDSEAKAIAAANVIDRYRFQMATTQGLATFLKSPILQVLSTLVTGSPALAHLLAAEIPVEVLPRAIGKVQMAYELFGILGDRESASVNLVELWPLIVKNSATPDRDAWAFGHAVAEHWQQEGSSELLNQRYETFLQRA
ncbi:MAG: GTPase [Cyanobacteria bacterium J06597_1]